MIVVAGGDEQRLDLVDAPDARVGQHDTEPLQIGAAAMGDLAQYVGKSPSECCRQFKAVTTMTLGEYIESVRLEKAAQLLKTGLQPVSRIGEIVGYPTCAYFIRRFKRKTGMTPARYRKTWVKSTTTA